MAIKQAPSWLSIGWVIALIVLCLAVVFIAVGKLDYVTGGLIIGLALACLLP